MMDLLANAFEDMCLLTCSLVLRVLGVAPEELYDGGPEEIEKKEATAEI